MVVPSPAVLAVLRSHFAHHLGAHVLEFVAQFDFFGHGHAVFGHLGCAPALLDEDVVTLGTESDLDRICQGIDALENLILRRCIVNYHFC